MTAPIPITDLTQTSIEGTGVFDVLMRANKAHLEAEFAKQRIRGPEYATVYLGSLQSVLQLSLEFLVQRQKISLEADLLAQQILLAEAEVEKAQASILQIEAQTALLTQQKLNAEVENLVLQAQKCKLDAEFDLLQEQKGKASTETALLAQKVVTEKAQVSSIGVDADSVIGKQKALYAAQTSGFARDAEQKAAKTLIDTWSTRRMTDEGTIADGTNMLNDAAIGRAVTKLLQGVNA